jgi:molecular chaperone DnaK (HSP70)
MPNPAWVPGMTGTNPNGRPKGASNKTTIKIKEAYQRLVEHNLDNMTDWLEQVADEDPKEALELVLKLSEYVIPKLARQEVTGADGDDLFKNVTFEFGPDINDDVNRLQTDQEAE